jgi:hypothetical protein
MTIKHFRNRYKRARRQSVNVHNRKYLGPVMFIDDKEVRENLYDYE